MLIEQLKQLPSGVVAIAMETDFKQELAGHYRNSEIIRHYQNRVTITLQYPSFYVEEKVIV